MTLRQFLKKWIIPFDEFAIEQFNRDLDLVDELQK